MANEPTPEQAANEGITEKPPAPAAVSENVTATPPVPLPPAEAAPAPINPTPTAPPAWLYKADLAILALLLVLTFFVGSFTATNSDLWMHLAIGQRISQGEFTFGEDPFSWLSEATADRPATFWVHQSWLYSWLFFQLHELIGGAGLVLIKAILFTIAVVLLSRIGWNEANRWFVLIALVGAALAVSPRLLLQPTVVSFLFLSITLFVLDRVGFFAHARPDGKTPDARLLWILPPLFALWANLDIWFILGPIVLGLCWAATGLTRWFPNTKVVPGKSLGLVFGVGVLACLVNPYHVRVFQLPPELAYLVVSVTDRLHFELSNEVVGAGRTLREMRPQIETGKGDAFEWTVPTVSWKYLSEPRFGWNIAGMSILPLLLLGLLAFTLTARVKPQPGAPSFHVGRFVLWLVFGVMALALYRLIPFFAIVAASLTGMTLGEFLHWQQTVSGISAEKRDRGLKLARLASIPFILLLIARAWPGWLQGATEYTSLRRVAWDVRAEPSLKRAAETLLALKKEGKCQNVCNGMNLDVAHYMSWYAPGVKFGIDNRFALYAGRVQEYGKARKTLDSQNPAEWQSYFAEHNVDQVAVANFIKSNGAFPAHFWLETEQWRQRDGDNRAVVFSWAGRDKRWPPDDDDAWNRAAFGPVPVERRPPPAGAMLPQTPSQLTLYRDGIAPTPIGVPEFALLNNRYQYYGEVRNLVGHRLSMFWMINSWTQQPTLPGGGMTSGPAFVLDVWPWVLSPRDIGPPALPILMMRSTRQAVAENPLDGPSRACLINAIEMRNNQEDRWAGAKSKLRERVRQIQLVANLNAMTQVQPEKFEWHRKFALVLEQEKMLDLALEHMQAAEKSLEAFKPPNANAEQLKKIELTLIQQREIVKKYDDAVRQRLAKWKEQTAALPPGKLSSQELAFVKADRAFHGDFEEVQGDRAVKAPFGLGKKAFEILEQIGKEPLPDRIQLPYLYLSYEILFAMGRPDEVMKSLKTDNIRKSLPPDLYALNLLLAGAALGDYDATEEALAALDKLGHENLNKSREAATERAGRFGPALLMTPNFGAVSALAAAVAVIDHPPYPFFEAHLRRRMLQDQQNELCNVITLRGIFALEAGNTGHARVLFQRALDEAADHQFTERPIARRYLDLLNGQKR
jgi:tetratricopeptide (TPR) repeat protein